MVGFYNFSHRWEKMFTRALLRSLPKCDMTEQQAKLLSVKSSITAKQEG